MPRRLFMWRSTWSRMLLIAGMGMIALTAVAAEAKYCESCGKRLRGRYIKSSDNRSYCSQKCFAKTLPKCSVCKKECSGTYFKANGKNYCSQKCFDKTLPKCSVCKNICRENSVRRGKRFFCSTRCAAIDSQTLCMRCDKPFKVGKKVPSPYGDYNFCMECDVYPKCLTCERPLKKIRKQRNGSYLCQDCDKDVVYSRQELFEAFRKVKNTLVSRLKFRFDHNISLEMRAHSADRQKRFVDTGELGFYHYSGREVISEPGILNFTGKPRKASVRYEDEKCSIVVMNMLPRIKLEEVLAHELAHDYMRHRWFYIKSDKVKEGFAEFVASEYNRICRRHKWNTRMEFARDPIYGEGYRMVREWYRKGNWREIYRQLDLINKRDMPQSLK